MKKIILALSSAIVGLLTIDHFEIYICNSYRCRDSSDSVLLGIVALLGISLIFTLVLTLFSKEVFLKWWKFARIAVPVILTISILINLKWHHNSGGLFDMDNMFDIPAHILMYIIFIVGSLVQIWRGYSKH